MFTAPTLLLDTQRCRKNIAEMAAKAKLHKVEFRPHFKTHQSLEIGRWFKEEGISKITVSSLQMAEYFSAEWSDITVAFPVNILEIDRINKLAAKIKLNLLVESVESIRFLKENIKHSVSIYLKIDCGYHRTGIAFDNYALIDSVLKEMEGTETLLFEGFLTHSGHTYKCRSTEEVTQIHCDSLGKMRQLKKHFFDRYPKLKISVGDTPGCSVAKDFEGADEIRPGNFVFYDLTQNAIGSCELDQIAVALACPVVAMHPERNEIVLNGGGVHFSKEVLHVDQTPVFGQVVEPKGNSWGTHIEGMYIKSLSQEHGIVHVPKERIADFNIGDMVYVLPVHSCMTANLMKQYYTTEGEVIGMMKSTY